MRANKNLKPVKLVKIVFQDTEYDRWYNGLVKQKVSVVDRNSTVYEVVEGKFRGCLIAKNKCEAVG